MTRRQRRTNATRRQQPAPLFVYWTLRTEWERQGWELIELRAVRWHARQA